MKNLARADSIKSAGAGEMDATEERLKREDLFVDYAERDLEDDQQPVGDQLNSDEKKKAGKGLPPKGAGDIFAKKQKRQLREGVKHMTKFSLQDNSLGSKSMINTPGGSARKTTKLMDRLLREDMEDRMKRLDRYKEMEEEKANRHELKKADKFFMDEKKWYREIISKVDIVPESMDYYEKLAVKPGFDFIYALINCKDQLDTLRICIPDTLYFNYDCWLLSSDPAGKISIKQSPKSKDFLDLIETRTQTTDIVKNWREPATVVKKATPHPCYTAINLLNWKQTYEHLRNGPSNRTLIQRYQPSFGEKLCLYRCVVHPEDLVNLKGSGKYNFCYALTNKVSYKASYDEEQKILDGFEQEQKAKKDKDGEEVKKLGEDSQRSSQRQKPQLNARFECRYLTCPFEVGSFDVYTYTGKTMQMMEKEAYKIFNFMERTFDMKLLNVVTDWIRDEKGTYWFIGLKSFKLREESYLHKTTKPSAFDRELLAINVNKKVHKIPCMRCKSLFRLTELEKNKVQKELFKSMKKVPALSDLPWIQEGKKYLKQNGVEDYLFCNTCIEFVLRDIDLYEIQARLACLEYIPLPPAPLTKEIRSKSQQLPSRAIKNNQRFRPKYSQWRILVVAHKLLDVNPRLLETKGHGIYLQYRFGEYVTRFQLSSAAQPIKFTFERVKQQTNYSRNQPTVVADTEAIKDENDNEVEVHLENKDLVRIVKINKAKVNYFFTPPTNKNKKQNISQFFQQCEMEFRVTFGQNWNNYVAVNKGTFLNFFSTVAFDRGSEAHFTRNMMLFTDTLESLNLRITMGVSMDGEVDLSDIPEQDLMPYLNQQVILPPEHFYTREIALNGLPAQWMNLIRPENTFIKQDIKDVGKKLYHPDGRAMTKMELYRLEQFGHVNNKLLNTTTAQRAGGKGDETISPSKTSTPKRTPKKGAGISIPDQIAKIAEKRKFTKKQYVMPSHKAHFYKKSRLAQNIKPPNDEEKKDESLMEESDEDTKKKGPLKLKFGDLFSSDEGMYHSVPDEHLRRSFSLLKTPFQDLEKHHLEEQMADLEIDERYNEGVFDQKAIERIQVRNLKRSNPYDPLVAAITKKERLDIKKAMEQMEQQKTKELGGRGRGKVQVKQQAGGFMGKVQTRKAKLEQQLEDRKKKEEEDRKLKAKEDVKFEQLKAQMTHKVLRNIRSVQYANFTTL